MRGCVLGEAVSVNLLRCVLREAVSVNLLRSAPIAVVLVVVTAACGSPAHHGQQASDTSSPGDVAGLLGLPTPAGVGGNDAAFLGRDGARVLFVRWTANGNALVGTVDETEADTSSKTGTATSEESITGVRNGDRVSLTLSLGLGSYKTLTGSVTDGGSTLHLTIPAPSGVLTDATLQASSVDQYNAAVAALSGRAQQQANQNAQQQQAAQAAKQAADRVQGESSALTSALSSLHDAEASLVGADLGFRSSLGETSQALAQARKDLAQEQHDYDASPRDCGTVSSDAGTVDSDEGSAESGQGSVESDTQGVRNDADRVASALASAQQATSTLAQEPDLGSAFGSLLGAVGPYAGRVPGEVSRARSAASKAEQSAQGLVNAAKDVAARADALDARCT